MGLTPRGYNLRRLYGITEEVYEELLARQEGKCPICERLYTEFKVRLAVDHDHLSGEIRGLLCNHCNRRVIGRNRDPDLLQRASEYLRVGTGLFVPEKPKKKRVRRPRKAKND